MSRSAWAKFATYISFHGGLFLGPMNDGAPFVEMFCLLISEEECELGVHIPNKPTSVEKIAADAKVPVYRAAAMLKHMSQKGACFERVTADGTCVDKVTPVIPGFYYPVDLRGYARQKKFLHRLDPAVKINGCKQRLESVGKYRRAFSAVRMLLAVTQHEIIPQPDGIRQPVKRLFAHRTCAYP